ncbi:fibronectin type III-like domain-contianing protein [Micromonospora sp. NPDC051296]|uniref:fibronectin type III-like domain-contianing protein n=1 Tax=Micromonospora sp. NPDC051296 TaxID=3155046 RepID=UPI00342AD699
MIGADSTYLYYRGDPLYPFGHGLSYTRFDYARLRLSAAAVTAGEVVEVSVDVTNTGPRPGEEVVQLYTRQRRSRVKQPLRQLRDFARVTLAPGECRTVTLRLRTAELAWWDADRGARIIEDATHTVLVGRSATDVRLVGAVAVRGEPVERRSRLHSASGAR